MAIVTYFPAGNPKMLCIFGGTDKSVPYNPIVIWRIAKQQFIAHGTIPGTVHVCRYSDQVVRR